MLECLRMTLSVKQDAYEGPLELLLELVSKERLDPADVSISQITDEYLQVVASMGEIDLDLATHFLVLAATLLELKSYKLLPVKEGSDGELTALLEERDHLVHRLIEYATFKQVAGLLSGRFALNEGYFCRTADVPKELIAPDPDPLEGLSAEMLAAAARRALQAKPAPSVDVAHLTPITVSVADAVGMLRRRIEESETVTFRALCRDAASRIEVIVRFLALLEMFKDQSVELDQDGPLGEIVVRHRRPAVKVAT
jgi:segregation and condensation protein A